MRSTAVALLVIALYAAPASAQDGPPETSPAASELEPTETTDESEPEPSEVGSTASEDSSADESASGPVEKPDSADAPETPSTDEGAVPAVADPKPADSSAVEPAFEEIDVPADQEKKPFVEGTVGAEYRVRSIDINPIELSGTRVDNIGWTEQRARLDASIGRKGVGAINLQMDALDGVIFGDNGSFVGTPKSNSGVSLSTKLPNLTRWEVGLLEGGDPLTRDDYGPVLVEAPPLEVNYLYADIFLPVGLLRVGRQPQNYGASIAAHEGGRLNRWGVSKYHNAVDRVLFGTKIDEAVKAIAGSDDPPDTSLDNGVIWAVFLDQLKHDDVARYADNLRGVGTAVQWRVKEADWFGADWSGFVLSQSFVHLWNQEFNSSVYGMPFYFETTIGPVDVNLQYMHIRGETEEISEGFAALASKEPELQKLRGHGARAVFDINMGPVTLTLEGDYASGDDDPRSSTPITSYSFARDLNIGLLMFEQIMMFESARSAGVGIENLSGADVESFPLTEAATDGRFTNAIAAFPQLYVEWLSTPNHTIHTRFGALFAWSAAKGGVVDPIMTSLAEDGNRIDDDAVNFHGGEPDRWYGTELDVQIGYTLRENFFWTVEGAVLLPGPALWDENQDAVNSFLVENRFVLAF